MKTFTLLTYSVTALISALTTSVVAVSGAESPAPKPDLSLDADYVYDYEFIKNNGLKFDVPSYSWALGEDDYKYDFVEDAAEPHDPRHIRRQAVSQIIVVAENTTIFYVLAPAAKQPPRPGVLFITATINSNDTEKVYYRPFVTRSLDGKPVDVPATPAQTRGDPSKLIWRPYRVFPSAAIPIRTVALELQPKSVLVKDLERVRAEQAQLQASRTRSVGRPSSVPRYIGRSTAIPSSQPTATV